MFFFHVRNCVNHTSDESHFFDIEYSLRIWMMTEAHVQHWKDILKGSTNNHVMFKILLNESLIITKFDWLCAYDYSHIFLMYET